MTDMAIFAKRSQFSRNPFPREVGRGMLAAPNRVFSTLPPAMTIRRSYLWLPCLVAVLVCACSAKADPLISEFLAINNTGAEDEDGERNDWIEIFNPDTAAVNLNGWHLTDNATNLSKWTFPAVTLPAKSFLLVWASNKNRTTLGGPLHTNFRLDSGGEYLALTRPDASVAFAFAPSYPAQAADVAYGLPIVESDTPLLAAGAPAKVHIPADGSLGTSWKETSFVETAWQNATTGVGYDDPIPPVGASQTWADSAAEFSGTQGANSWSYGYWNHTTDANKVYEPGEFNSADANWTFGGSWELGPGNPPWTGLNALGGHPNGSNNGAIHWAIRRYTSEFSGQAHIAGTISNASGDGTVARIIVDGVEVFYRHVQNATYEYSVNAEVQLGSKVDFVIDPGPTGNDGADSTTFTARVVSNVLAESVADWSPAGTQGARGWTYGYYNKTVDAGSYTAAKFVAFPRTSGNTVSSTNAWNGTNWQISATSIPLTAMTSTGATASYNTGATPAIHWPIRRWTSTYAGRVRIGGIMTSPGGGDGFSGKIYVNGTQLLAKTVNATSEGYAVFADVAVGSLVDVIMDPLFNENGDVNATFTVSISAATIGAAVVADSAANWGSGTQGTGGWNHGYYNLTDDANSTYESADFVSANANWTFSGGAWIMGPGDPPWTRLAQRDGHPNGTNQAAPNNKEHWVLRRWTSTVTGTVAVEANVAKANALGGGTTLKIFHNGAEKDSVALAGSDTVGTYRTVVLTNVAIGDKIDVALTPVGLSGNDDGNDSTYFGARILYNSLPPNVTLTKVADSIADWSTTGQQGYKGWTYGYYNKTTDADATFAAADFIPFPRDSGPYSAGNLWNGSGYDWYLGNPPWTELYQTGVHPNGTNNGHEHWCIRRWTSTVSGALSVTWKVNKTNPAGGGVSVRCFHNGVQKDTGAISGTDTTGITRTFTISSVGVGDKIDICLTPVGLAGGTDDGADGSAFSAQIFQSVGFTDAIGVTGDIKSLMKDINSTAYIRVPFNLATVPQFDRLRLRLRYDDGLVCYLNGQQVLQRNAPVAAVAAVLADSVAEFSGVQGQANWLYGYYNKSVDPNLTYSDGDFNSADPNWGYSGAWALGPGDPPWTNLTNTGGHPNGTNSGAAQWAVRRWMSETEGTVSARIRLARGAAAGNGITGRLFVNGVEKWSRTIAAADTAGAWHDLQLTDLKLNDRVDLAMDSLGTDGAESDVSDGSLLSLYLEQQAAAGLAWNSAAAQPRPASEVGTVEEVDLTAQRFLLANGVNVLAVHGLNATKSDLDFLMLPELIATTVTVNSAQQVYFLTPTPATLNGSGATTIGPVVANVTDSLVVGDADNIIVQATVTQTLNPINSVRMRYRVLYNAEAEVVMFDDGVHNDLAANDGVFGAVIPASASNPGEMVRWRIIADDTVGNITRSPSFADPANSPEYWGTVVMIPNAVAGGQLPVLHWFTANTAAHDGSGGGRCSIFYNGQFLDNVGADLHGQSSSGFPKKSYDFHLNTSYKLEWDSTPTNDTPRVNSFNLLSTYPDKAYMRNLLAYETFRQAGVPAHWALPVQVRRNNAFFSVAHMVEDGDEDYLQRAPTLDDQGALYKMYNTFTDAAGGEKKSRKFEGNQDLTAFIAGLGQSGVARERYIYDNAGIPETVNYMTAHILIGNTDCCHKNYYVYRDSEGNQEWRPLPWDVDLSFGRVWTGGYFDDTMYANTGFYIGNGNRFMTPFVDNSIPALKQMYLRRLRTLADTILQPSSLPVASRWMEGRIDSWKAQIEPDVLFEKANTAWGTWGTAQTMAQAVTIMRDQYLPARRTFVLGHADLPASQSPTIVVIFGSVEVDPISHNQDEEYFSLTNPNGVAVDISGWQMTGAVDHTFKPGTVIPASGTLYVSPNVNAFRTRAVSPKGNEGRFIQGNYTGQLSTRGETLTLMDGARVVATTTYAGTPSLAQNALRITEIMYHPGLKVGDIYDADEYEYLELKNTGTVAIPLAGIHFTSGIDFSFTSGTLNPGAYIVLVKNADAFTQRYPGIPVGGIYVGALDNGGERLQLLDANNEEVLDFSYADVWHPVTDGAGFSLQVVNELAAPDDWALPTQWQPSGKLCGTPGGPDAVGDADSDGMADLWEAQNGLNPQDPSDGGGTDNDADGQTNVQEYLAGTDPNQPQSILRINFGSLVPGGAYVSSFEAKGGKTYTVQVSNDLTPASWQKISDFAPTVDGTIPFTDPGAATARRRFYRVLTPQQP